MIAAARDFAARHFEIAPILEHLRARARQTGKPVEMPEPPAEVAHVWGWFAELHGQRTEFGQPLRWLDIWAWADLHGHRLSPLELETLKAFDAAYLDYCKREAQKRGN